MGPRRRGAGVLSAGLLATLTILAGAETAAAQSLFAGRGLGYPIESVDARSRGLGGAAMGLPGADVSWANPAAAVRLPAPAFIVGYQYDNFTSDAPTGEFDGRSTRFPLILGAFPLGERFTIQAGFGSFLDQNWLVEIEDTLLIGGDTVPVIDRSTAAGGVSRLRVGAGYAIGNGLSLAAGVDMYTGELERVSGRVFEQAPWISEPQSTAWQYRGVGYTAGLHWSRNADLGVGVSATFGGTLDANVDSGDGVSRSYDLPATLRGGASGRVGQNTLVVLSGNWTGWSTLDEALAGEGGAEDSWSVEGGIEWEGLTIRARPVPLRIGARTAMLPFRWSPAATDPPNERALSLGFGADLAGGAARSDIAVEFGNRGGSGAGIDESYWRFNLSVRVLGR